MARNYFHKITSKKTRAISKNKQNFKNVLRVYLKNYAEEAGKLQAQGKTHDSEGKKLEFVEQEPEEYNRLTRNDALIDKNNNGLWCGGFFLEDVNHHPSNNETETKIWIDTICERWNIELSTKTKRRADAIRHVISLDPYELNALKESNKPVESFLKEIWTNTLEVYKKENGWENEQLSFVNGFHMDKAHIHMHVCLFPTTKTGIPLRFSDKPKSLDVEQQKLTGFNALLNIEAEKIWRRDIKLEYQNPDVCLYRKQGMDDPPIQNKEYYTSKNSKLKNFSYKIAKEADEEMLQAQTMLSTFNDEIKIGKEETRIESLNKIACLWAYDGFPALDNEITFNTKDYTKKLKGTKQEIKEQNIAANHILVWQQIQKEEPNKKEKTKTKGLINWLKKRINNLKRWAKGEYIPGTDSEIDKLKDAKEKNRIAKKKLGHIIRQSMGEVKSLTVTENKNIIETIKTKLPLSKNINKLINEIPGEIGYFIRKQSSTTEYDSLINNSQKNIQINALQEILEIAEEQFVISSGTPNPTLVQEHIRIETTATKLMKQEYQFVANKLEIEEYIYQPQVLNQLEEDSTIEIKPETLQTYSNRPDLYQQPTNYINLEETTKKYEDNKTKLSLLAKLSQSVKNKKIISETINKE